MKGIAFSFENNYLFYYFLYLVIRRFNDYYAWGCLGIIGLAVDGECITFTP